MMDETILGLDREQAERVVHLAEHAGLLETTHEAPSTGLMQYIDNTFDQYAEEDLKEL